MRSLSIIGLALVAFATQSQAAIHVESGDAGQSIATAQSTGSLPLTAITGLIGDANADIFKINIPVPGLFSASTVGSAGFDTQLFLFDAAGLGVLSNDDAVATTSGFGSLLPAGSLTGPPGIYYIAISGFNLDPVSVGGLIFPTGATGVHGPTGPGGGSPLSGWEGSTNLSGNGYVITLAGAVGSEAGVDVVPEPASMIMWGLGTFACVLGAIRRRKMA